ncbi:MAG: metal-sensitive transcriptional regulator [Desulfobacterium sp.]|nr:metal-sensitive transcriptional regulator [Desulfobacterium sp.]
MAYPTGVGYRKRNKGVEMINEAVKKDALVRLKKIEGQIRGIAKMVENEKYCIDIINQITAAEKALTVVSKNVMKRHVESCVREAILKGEGQGKINELIETVYKYAKK